MISLVVLFRYLSVVAFFVGTAYAAGSKEKVLEVEKLVIKNPHSQACIELQVVGNQPMIVLKDQHGVALGSLAVDQTGVLQLSLNDGAATRLQVRGGSQPSLLLLDQKQEMLGGFFSIAEEGSGLVLCNRQNKISTLIRGGENPGINFYEREDEPTIALGVVATVPHFLLSGKYAADGMLVHGGEPTSLLFLDGKGEVQVAVSRLGFYTKQMKDAEKQQERPQFFSLDELKKQLRETNKVR